MSKKLLLADDSITIQKVIGITFANEDFELTTVDNGDAAFEQAKIIRPDLILADVLMPGKNGYELCSAIKQDPDLRTVPVLLLTGTFEPFDENKANAAGAESWIAKPFESQALIDRVEQLLSSAPSAEPRPAIAEPQPSVPEAKPEAAKLQPSVPEQEPSTPEPQPGPVEPLPAAGLEEGPGMEDVDVWGDLGMVSGDEETPVPEEAPIADPWADISFDEDELEAAPEIGTESATGFRMDDDLLFEEEEEEEFLFAEVPQTAGLVEAETAPSAAESEWGDFEEDVLSLDENDILEAEDLVVEEEEGLILGEEEPEPEIRAPAEDISLAGEEGLFEAPEVPAAGLGGEEFIFPEDATPETGELSSEFEEADSLAAEAGAVGEETEWDFGEELEKETVSFAAEASPTKEPQAATEQAGVVETPVAALSEEDLEPIVERVAKEVIERLAGTLLEKIAWEVVPDLAESLIRDEIRKIKERAA